MKAINKMNITLFLCHFSFSNFSLFILLWMINQCTCFHLVIFLLKCQNFIFQFSLVTYARLLQTFQASKPWIFLTIDWKLAFISASVQLNWMNWTKSPPFFCFFRYTWLYYTSQYGRGESSLLLLHHDFNMLK